MESRTFSNLWEEPSLAFKSALSIPLYVRYRKQKQWWGLRWGIAYHILSYLILPYPILPYPILSYPILSYPILSNPILSYPIAWHSRVERGIASHSSWTHVMIWLACVHSRHMSTNSLPGQWYDMICCHVMWYDRHQKAQRFLRSDSGTNKWHVALHYTTIIAQNRIE